MTKQSGLGDAFYYAGYDFSGDFNSIKDVGGGPAVLDYTDITQSAMERIGVIRDGRMAWVNYLNPVAARAHPVESALPRTDVGMAYIRGLGIGNPAACMVGKQPNYDPKRGNDGSLLIDVDAVANTFGLSWGMQLTNGARTDVAATNGVGADLTTVTTAFGAHAFLQVFSVTGTDVTVKIQDSADNITFNDITGGFSFAEVVANGGSHSTQRIATATPTTTIRRYLRAVTTTAGGFSNLQFAVVAVRNESLVSF